MKKNTYLLICFIIIWLICITLIVIVKTKDDVSLVISNNNKTSSIVYSLNDDTILYGENIHNKMLPASLTKLMTLLVSYKYLDINKIVHVKKHMLNTLGSSIYLKEDDLVSVKDLLYGLILQSGNDCASVLSYCYNDEPESFIELMNNEAKLLGLNNTLFSNPSGLDDTNYNYTTSYDLTMIVKEILKYDYLKLLLGTKKYIINLEDRTLYLKHKHKLLFKDNFMIGGKTAFTKKAGRCLFSIYEKEKQVLLIITLNKSNDWVIHNTLAKKFLN